MVMLQHVVRRPAGYLIGSSEDAPAAEWDMVQCVHCSMHFRVVPGSGTQRGFCFKCAGATCGKRRCVERCLPAEAELDAIERAARRSQLDAAIERTRAL